VAERGERQRLTLALVSRLGKISSQDMVNYFGLSRGGASTELARYWRQGLLHRHRVPGIGPAEYEYTITRNGLNRARWWISQGLMQPQEQEPLVGLEEFRPRLQGSEPGQFRPKLIE